MSFFIKAVTGPDTGFGKDLKNVRIVRGLSEIQLSKLCGIHSEVIRALEDERFTDLQDPFYAERLVRTLAKTLDIRPEFLVLKYLKALESKGFQKSHTSALRPIARTRDFFVTSKIFIAGGILAVASIFLGYEVWQVRLISAAPQLIIIEPEEGFTSSDTSIQIRGTTESGAFVTVNNVQVVVQPDNTFATILHIPAGLTTVHVEAKKRHGNPTIVERRVVYLKK